MSQYFTYDPTTGVDSFNFTGVFNPASVQTGPVKCNSLTLPPLAIGIDTRISSIDNTGLFNADSANVVGYYKNTAMSTTPALFHTNGSNALTYNIVLSLLETVVNSVTWGVINLVCYLNADATFHISAACSSNLTPSNPNPQTLNIAIPGGKILIFTVANNSNISVSLAAIPNNPTTLSMKFNGIKAIGIP